MPTEPSTGESKEIVEKVQNLCKLAASSNENEARTAAMQAVRLMNEHDLAFVPRTELENVMKAVEGAREMQVRAKQEATKNMLLGGLIGAFVGRKFL